MLYSSIGMVSTWPMSTLARQSDQAFRQEVQTFLDSSLTDELREAGRKKNQYLAGARISFSLAEDSL